MRIGNKYGRTIIALLAIFAILQVAVPPTYAQGGMIVGRSNIAAGFSHATLWKNVDNTYIPTDLGTLPAGISSSANAINDNGQIVGSSTNTDSSADHGVIWNQRQTFPFDYVPTDLGTLGGKASFAVGINNNGRIVGMAQNARGRFRPVVWNKVNNKYVASVLSCKAGNCTVAGINNNGQIVGQYTDFFGSTNGIVWTQRQRFPFDYVPTGLTGGKFGSANGINDNGQIVGWTINAALDSHAVLWNKVNKSYVITDLGTPGKKSVANAINNFGLIVGNSNDAGDFHAVVWNQLQHFPFNYVPTDLGTLPEGRCCRNK